MKWIKGMASPNPQGRGKGVRNKASEEVKAFVEDLVRTDKALLKRQYKGLSAKDRINFFIQLLPFVLPKMASIDQKTKFENMTDEQLDTIINELKKSAA
jgi:hypothetical protein